jgi:hypothetical protein
VAEPVEAYLYRSGVPIKKPVAELVEAYPFSIGGAHKKPVAEPAEAYPFSIRVPFDKLRDRINIAGG